MEEDFRNKYPAEFLCNDGHRVRSLSEQAIDNWLYSHQIPHAYEPIVPIPEQLIPDFQVNTADGSPIYMEFWGMLDDELYKHRMYKKMEIYAKYSFPVIELRPEDLKNLDFVLNKRLQQKKVPLY